MPTSLTKSNHWESRASEAEAAWAWHQDCLASTVLMASALSEKTMRRLLKRADIPSPGPGQGTEHLLAALHAGCHQDPDLRAGVAKELNKKFASAVASAGKLDPDQAAAQAQQRPWVIPLLWACCQHPSPQVRGAGRQLAHRALWEGMQQLRGLDQAGQEKGRSQGLARENAALRQRLAQAREDNRGLKRQIGRQPASPAAPPRSLALAPTEPKRQLKELRRQLAQAQKEIQELRQEMVVWRSLACQMDQQAASAGPLEPTPLPICENQSLEPAAATCPRRASCPLRGTKVAVVGGLERMEPSYRQVVERLGGKCLFHCGHMRAGPSGLRQVVAKSDLVICITSVNSHGAMSVVKKECKRCRKRFCPMNGAGAGALENLLREVTG